MRYRAVLFDLDGTLVSEQVGVEAATARVAAALRDRGHAVSDEALNAARSSVVGQALAANEGTWPSWLTREEWMRRAFRLVDAPEDLAPDMAPVYLEGRLDGLSLLEHARELLDAVRAIAPLGLITNGEGAEQRRKLERVGLDPYFPMPVISGELGVAKPDARIFQHALAALAVAADDAVYIGNSFGHDIEGAAAVGLHSVWLDHAGTGPPAGTAARPSHVVRELRAVRAFLGV